MNNKKETGKSDTSLYNETSFKVAVRMMNTIIWWLETGKK